MIIEYILGLVFFLVLKTLHVSAEYFVGFVDVLKAGGKLKHIVK